MSAHKQLSVSLDVLLSNYSDICKAELGTIDFKDRLLVKSEMIPFCNARSVPFVTKGATEEDSDRLEAAEIVEWMTHSDWVALIVALP